MNPYASPQRVINPAELRPRRIWLVIAPLIAVVGIAVAVVILVTLLSGSGPSRTFGAGETVTVHLKKDPRPGFYVTDAGSPNDQCYVRTASGQQIRAKPISGSATINQWHVLSHVDLPADGTYQVTCTGSNPSARYGVGTPPETGSMVGGIFAAILIPIAAILAAIVIVIVVLVRRSSHRRRLLTAPPVQG